MILSIPDSFPFDEKRPEFPCLSSGVHARGCPIFSGRNCLVMEYIDGERLGRPLAVEKAAS
jgi:hypothetical protein